MRKYKLMFPEAIGIACNVACAAGQLISKRHWASDVTLEDHVNPELGTTSKSDIDAEAELWIITHLQNGFPEDEVLFVGEEGRKNIDPAAIFKAPLAFIIDPRDGTTEDSHELYSWCVSIGVMERGRLTGGAVYAPEVRGGMLISAQRGTGVWIAEHSSLRPLPIEEAVKVAAGAKPVIVFGLDVNRSDHYQAFTAALPKNLRPRGIAASGALGLALVAAGRVDAIVQSPQLPWDWAGAMAMVQERQDDLRIYPFRIDDGKLNPLAPIIEIGNFRFDKQTLGFVVGKKELADPLFQLLVDNYDKKVKIE
jgi:myo-inositol-1(or 4)-monophosphatase